MPSFEALGCQVSESVVICYSFVLYYSMIERKPIPTNIGEYLRYDDGMLFWTQRPANRVKVGDRAGSVNKSSGYRTVFFRGKHYQEHRVVWFLHHGQPTDHIDHKNDDKADNRIENLHLVTHSKNMQGRAYAKDSDLPRWVIRQGSRYGGQFQRDGVMYWAGTFDTPNEAHKAAQEKIAELDS